MLNTIDGQGENGWPPKISTNEFGVRPNGRKELFGWRMGNRSGTVLLWIKRCFPWLHAAMSSLPRGKRPADAK